ncbi:MAG: hypothetical protein HY598_03260 [Candidatus Omnitrophica bacterium]|nr:hypothetical protein [Candidatus Omnitrophota bacterium]
MTQLPILLQRFAARYRAALMAKAAVFTGLGASCCALLAWRLDALALDARWRLGLPLALAAGLLIAQAVWLRRQWMDRRKAAAFLDRALSLQQRLITAEEFSRRPGASSLYPVLLEEIAGRFSMNRVRFPRPLDHRSGVLAAALLLLLLWPRLNRVLPPVLRQPEEQHPADSRQQTAPNRQQDQQSAQSQSLNQNQDQSQQGGQGQPQSAGGQQPQPSQAGGQQQQSQGGGQQEQPSAHSTQPSAQSQQQNQQSGQGQQPAAGSQQQAGQQGGQEQHTAHSTQQTAQSQQQAASDQHQAQGQEQQTADSKQQTENQSQGQSQNRQTGQRGRQQQQAQGQQKGSQQRQQSQEAQAGSGQQGSGQTFGEGEALKADIQQLLKEMSGELKNLQAQLASAEAQPQPQAGTSTDPHLYGGAESLEDLAAKSAHPIQLKTDSAATQSGRPDRGVGKPSGDVSAARPKAEAQDAQLTDQPLEESAASRQPVPAEYRSIFDHLQQRSEQ